MAPTTNASKGSSNDDLCPVCNREYREERMVECTNCKKWCCYECVNVADDHDVIQNDSWICPICETNLNKMSHKNDSLSKSKISHSNHTKSRTVSVVSSRTQIRLQLLEEEKNLLRQERELIRESRKIVEEDYYENQNGSQIINEVELQEVDSLANQLLSQQIESIEYANENDNKVTKSAPVIDGNLQNVETIRADTIPLCQIPTSSMFQKRQMFQPDKVVHQNRPTILDYQPHFVRNQLPAANLSKFPPVYNTERNNNVRFTEFRNQRTLPEAVTQSIYQLPLAKIKPPNPSNQVPLATQIPATNNSHIPVPVYNVVRKNMVNDLPIFGGNPSDWPLFYSSFERSTNLYDLSNEENLIRLQKCLKGPAKVSVASFLILPECVPQIISTLKILYGRPEQIINAHINAIRSQPSPRPEKLESLVEFGLSVKNLCVSLQAANLNEYLNNPTLMHELIEKLPSQFKVNWALHRSTLANFQGLSEFADWLYNVAVNVCTALPALTLVDHNKHNNNYKNERIHLHESSDNIFKCRVCDENCRNASSCEKFQQISVPKRWEIVKKLYLCKLCLKKHRYPCKYPVKCKEPSCHEKHHPLLHKREDNISRHSENNKIPEIKNSTSANINFNNSFSSTSSQPTEFSMTQVGENNINFRIIPVCLKNGSKEVKTYAFLDEGSSVSLMNESVAQKLNLEGNPEKLCLKWTGDQERLETNSQKVLLTISGNFPGATDFNQRSVRTVSELILPKQSLDARKMKNEYPYLRNIPFQSYYNANPEILIGLDNWNLALPLKVKEGSEKQPIALKCRLGWSVFGTLTIKPQAITECHSNFHICACNQEKISNQALFENVKEYFSIESLGVQNTNSLDSKELQRARKIQENTLSQHENQYTIGLLWKYDQFKLPESKGMALQRLECIEKRIKMIPELGIKMNQQLQDLIDKNYIRKLTEEELSQNYKNVWYLPIFTVFNPNKPGRFRIVWDAAASVKNVSLNSMLLKGDDQLASLLGVLLRFREKKIGFSGDIKEMFLRVGIRDEDQQAQRFIWRDGSSENNLETYVMRVMTFGATCSPSCAQFVKNTNAKKYITEYPRAVECILNNHYVDDLLDCADTEEEAIQIAKQVKLIHAKGNFEIRNWRSNSMKLNETMNSNTQNLVEINLNGGDENPKEKVLGMWWDLTTDSFVFSLKFNKGNKEILNGQKKPTKREILRILMSIYDPLGLLAKFLIYLKILLQEIWKSKVTWDQYITNEQYKKWNIWLSQLPKIENISIPRCYLKNIQNWTNVSIQMHIFVDASEHASATVAYLRMETDCTTECVLIGAKTKVAPIKLQTIPRLELNGALMGARFAKNLTQHLSININEIFYWSDSIIVLSWLRAEDLRKLPKYVAFRVAEIQENSMISNWRYVPTKLNVADEATKWPNQINLHHNDRWFKGPDFLYQTEEFWPSDSTSKAKENKEILTTHQTMEPLTKFPFEKFSKYRKLLNTMAYVNRFIHNCRAGKQKNQGKSNGILTSEELIKAQNMLISLVQIEFYQDEIKQLKKKHDDNLEHTVNKLSKLYKLSPCLDNDGLLRVRGRLDNASYLREESKRPIILPRESYLTLLIVEEYHRKYFHQNHETVVNEIRQKYFIPKIRRVVNKIKNKCQFCKVKLAKPELPEMAPLPICRLAAFTAPFTYTGVDYFGPIMVTVGRRVEKRWGALFTCLTIRAVHLEVAYKLDAENCILCFTNFMNRKGRPRHVYCDRGTNFIATERLLKEELKNLDPNLIANKFVNPEMKFHFNTPLSPHMGGAWERLIKAVKISLYNALPSRTPTDQLLNSCLLAAENIVNSRPLTYLPLDSEESESLTPNHFLLGSSNGDKPMAQVNDDKSSQAKLFIQRTVRK